MNQEVLSLGSELEGDGAETASPGQGAVYRDPGRGPGTVSPGRPQGEATPREVCPTSPEAPVTPLLAEAWPLSSRTESLSCRGSGAGSLRTRGGLLTPERTTAQGFFLIRHSQGRAYTPLHS